MTWSTWVYIAWLYVSWANFRFSIGVTDYIVLYALPGQTGETVFLFDSEPTVDLSDAPNINSTFSDQKLILRYTLDGSQFIPIKQSDNSTLVVIIMDKTVANQWHAPVISSGGLFGNSFSIGSNETWVGFSNIWTRMLTFIIHSVLVGGPYIVRNATISGGILSLVSNWGRILYETKETLTIPKTGDLNGTTTVEIVAPPTVTAVSWNGATAKTSVSSRGTLTSNITVENPALAFPTFDSWKVSGR